MSILIIISATGCLDEYTETCSKIKDDSQMIIDKMIQDNSIEDVLKLKTYINTLTEKEKNEKLQCWVNSFGGGIKREPYNGLSISELYNKYSIIALKANGYNNFEEYNTFIKKQNEKIAREKAAREQLDREHTKIALQNGYNSWNEYQQALNQPTMNAEPLRNLACTLAIPATEMASGGRATACKLDWNGSSERFFITVETNIGTTIKYEYFDLRKHNSLCNNLKNVTASQKALNDFGKCYKDGKISIE